LKIDHLIKRIGITIENAIKEKQHTAANLTSKDRHSLVIPTYLYYLHVFIF
ncbi:hypothetical protein LCGC14_1278180, partial [marine sediment metagenome]